MMQMYGLNLYLCFRFGRNEIASTLGENFGMVEPSSTGTQIYGVQVVSSERDRLLNGILHSSHELDETTYGRTHNVERIPLYEFEIQFLVSEEKML